jgi:hypothetical protein
MGADRSSVLAQRAVEDSPRWTRAVEDHSAPIPEELTSKLGWSICNLVRRAQSKVPHTLARLVLNERRECESARAVKGSHTPIVDSCAFIKDRRDCAGCLRSVGMRAYSLPRRRAQIPNGNIQRGRKNGHWRRIPLFSPRYRISFCRSSLTKDTVARAGRSAMAA